LRFRFYSGIKAALAGCFGYVLFDEVIRALEIVMAGLVHG
jgi:hypothetical protein